MAAADIKFNKTSMKIEEAYNLGEAAVQAYTAWTTASYNAEVKNIMSAYPSQYEQAKRIESLNKEYQLAAAFNPNLALTQYELLAGRGYTQFDDTTKSIAEKNSLEEISKSISKFTKPSELKQMVHEIKQKHKDTFGSLNTNFEANLNSYMDSADYMYKYPPEGKASYIQNANATLIDNQVNTLFSAETITSAEDFEKGFDLISQQAFSPDYAGNVHLQIFTSMASKISDPQLLNQLRETVDLHQQCYTFRRGHRVMVHLQSSWLPLVDGNPQTFTDIPRARPEDFRPATQRVYRSAVRPSSITLPVEPPPAVPDPRTAAPAAQRR